MANTSMIWLSVLFILRKSCAQFFRITLLLLKIPSSDKSISELLSVYLLCTLSFLMLHHKVLKFYQNFVQTAIMHVTGSWFKYLKRSVPECGVESMRIIQNPGRNVLTRVSSAHIGKTIKQVCKVICFHSEKAKGFTCVML